MDTEDVPQNQPLEASQVANRAGGFGWKVQDFNRLRRFLCLGAEGGTYYVSEKQLGLENAQCILKLIEDGKGNEVVKEIVEFSVEGRAAKQNPVIFALALCARQDKNEEVKKEAYKHVSEVCRIPTHLFTFVEYCEQLSKGSGWGRAHRRAITSWYNSYKDEPVRLALQVTKYQNRNGWCHRDLLRLSHIKPESDGVALVMKYIIKGLDEAKEQFDKPDVPDEIQKTISFLNAVEEAKKAKEDYAVIELINTFNLVREHIPTGLLNSVGVWRALLQKMPMTAMIRNLGKMSSIGLLKEGTEETKLVVAKLKDESALKKAKIHPFNVLVALKTYEKGKGIKGSLQWEASKSIIHALDQAFYKSFKFVEPTNQRYCLAVDVSGSMDFYQCNGSPITPREAAAALAMVTVRTEENCEIIGFSDKLVKLPIKKDMTLDQVLDRMKDVPMGGTDCAQPMLWAKKRLQHKFDCFVVYTDCETWAGKVHPAEALRQYRAASGVWNSKLIVAAMTSNGFTLADPEDPGMLDMVGFDSAGPEVMRNFVLGML